MTKEEAAKKLDGREYPFHLTDYERGTLHASGLVVVYGASDDLMEFKGALNAELGAYVGATAYVHSGGVLDEDGVGDDGDLVREIGRRGIASAKAKCPKIEAVWCPEDDEPVSWVYRTEIPHATFEVMEDGEVYCRGIVFEFSALPVVEELNL